VSQLAPVARLGDNRRMPNPACFTRAFISSLLVSVAFGGAITALPAQALQNSQSQAEQATAKQKLADLRSKMEALAKQQADTAARMRNWPSRPMRWPSRHARCTKPTPS